MIELFTLMMGKQPLTKYFWVYLDNARDQHARLLEEWITQTKKDTGVTRDLMHLPAYSPEPEPDRTHVEVSPQGGAPEVAPQL